MVKLVYTDAKGEERSRSFKNDHAERLLKMKNSGWSKPKGKAKGKESAAKTE